MSTRRERLERKVDRRREWAEKASARSDAAHAKVRTIADNIPFGQPILVGHHSERHARRDAERIHSGMGKAVAESKLASHHEQKASGLEHQLERSIFSDDENAVELLEAKAKRHDELAERCNAINKSWRKGGREQVAADHGEKAAASAAAACAMFSYLARKGPMDASHDRAEARRCRQRIQEIERRAARAQKAEAAGGVLIARSEDHNWATVTFAEKPDRSILEALRAAGYGWASGSWCGYLDKLPASVAELVASSAAPEQEAAE